VNTVMNRRVPYIAGNFFHSRGFLKRTMLHELVDIGTRPIIRIILSGISAHGARKCYALLATKFIDTDQSTGRCVECSHVSSSGEVPRFAES